jgi:hypothetical protein
VGELTVPVEITRQRRKIRRDEGDPRDLSQQRNRRGIDRTEAGEFRQIVEISRRVTILPALAFIATNAGSVGTISATAETSR